MIGQRNSGEAEHARKQKKRVDVLFVREQA